LYRSPEPGSGEFGLGKICFTRSAIVTYDNRNMISLETAVTGNNIHKNLNYHSLY